MAMPALHSRWALRSVNLERDLATPLHYILTEQALKTLQRLAQGLASPAPAARAYTLTGPYGVGKSAFAAFLTQLACPALPRHAECLQQLGAESPPLVDNWRTAAQLKQGGLLPLVCVGARMPLRRCLVRGITTSLKVLQKLSPPLENALHAAAQADTDEPLRELIEILYTQATSEWGYAGVLLIVDELGKLLEYQAYEGTGDLYLLQQLAEFACNTEPPGFNLITILHQGFEAYLNRLSEAAQREWAKIQGRFVDIPFYEPPHHLLPLIATVLRQHTDGTQPVAHQRAEQAVALELCPRGVSETEFRRWCLDAQSLHPTVLVALPYLFRRWAQHERSLFAYLFSSEPFAVPDVLARAPSRPVRLHDLYEYVAEHATGSWNAPALTHTVTVAQEVLARLKDPSPLQVQIIKTIAIISVLGEGCPVRPTLPHIAFALDEPPAEIADALQTLIQQGVLTYRRYNQCYYLWEGSHIDLEERLQKYRAHAVAGVAEQLTQIYPLPPLVAHRHSYDFGVLRYFEARYCETPTSALPPRLKQDAAGQILVCLPRSNAEHAQFCEWAQSDLFREAFDRVVVVAAPAPRLHEMLQDYIALWQLLHQDEAVQQDPIARREVEARLNELQSLVRTQLQRALGLTTGAERTPLWFYRSQPLGAVEGRGVSQQLSNICDAIYFASPRLRNELIQRRQLSSAVAAARRNLIEAMLNRAHLPRLGIQGHPPELSLYRSLLEATQLHRLLPNGEWGFAPPEPDSDPTRLRPVWEHLYQRILSAFPEQIPLSRLIAELESPPFGVLPSVFPILLCALWLTYRDELSLYREGRFIPEPTIADWELLLRRPDLFSIGGVRITAAEQAILDALSTVLATEPRLGAVVRALVRRLRNLPEYALRTRQLPQPSLALRETVVNASSPERLVFYDLPAALGIDVTAQNAALQLARQLQAALEDIEHAYPQLLRRARQTILSTLGFPDTDSGWHSFLQMCRDNKERVLHPALKPLLHRAAATTDEQSALESILAYITGRPPRAWSDIDTERFAQQFQAIANLLQEQLGEAFAPISPEKDQQAREIARQIYAALAQHPQPIDAELLRAILRHVEQLHLTRQESDNVESTTNRTEVE